MRVVGPSHRADAPGIVIPTIVVTESSRTAGLRVLADDAGGDGGFAGGGCVAGGGVCGLGGGVVWGGGVACGIDRQNTSKADTVTLRPDMLTPCDPNIPQRPGSTVSKALRYGLRSSEVAEFKNAQASVPYLQRQRRT